MSKQYFQIKTELAGNNFALKLEIESTSRESDQEISRLRTHPIPQSWASIIKDLKICLKLPEESEWAFQYFDDEGDCVLGKSEAEWKAALRCAIKDSTNKSVFHLQLMPLGEKNCCNLEDVSAEQHCDKDSTSACCKSNSNGEECKFPCKRPIPELEFDENRPPPPKIVNETQHLYKYTGEALRACVFPLGPIGQGSIAIAGDGGLRQWQINNKVSHDAHVPDSFFAIRVDSSGVSKSVVLQSNALYDDSKFKPEPYISDHVIPAASKQLLKDLPGVKTLEVTAKFPTVQVNYTSNEVPVKIELEAFSPKIPLNSLDSGIPVIIYNFIVTNNTTTQAKVSLMGTLQNIIGWNCYDAITNEVDAKGYGGNINSLYSSAKLYGIDMSNPSVTSSNAFSGQVSLAFMKQPNDQFSSMTQFNSAKELWKYFTGDGLPGQGYSGASQAGKTWNGAASCERSIEAGKSTTFTYMLAWRFPNRYRDWPLYTSIPNTQLYVGNQYNKHWKTAIEVLEYAATNYSRLYASTIKFRDAMFNTTIAWQFVDSAANRVSVLNSPTCFWSEDGNMYAFEGCCPLNCTHVWNYEQCLAKLYPDLERTMREIDLLHQINPYGVVPSRTSCPLELRRVWEQWQNYSTHASDTNICVDGEIGTVLKTYREIKHGAPRSWFDQMWPPVKKIMNRWMNELDTGNGLINGAQPNTYDVSIYGVTTFIGAYYLCALRATEEMAKTQGDTALEKLCNERFKIGSANLDKACFSNGKWYTQLVDPTHEVQLLTDATFMDALVGQWWAHSLGLGYLLPAEHIKSSLKYTASKNYCASFDPAKQYPRKFADQRDTGYFLGHWDEGPPKNQLYYTNEYCWSGVLHAFVGLCLYEGLTDIATTAVTTIRQSYDGTRRSPWNEIECGDFYARAMSAFLYFQILSGQEWEYAGKKAINLKFAPKSAEKTFRGFFIVGSAWGQFSQILNHSNCKGIAKIEVMHGCLELASLALQCQAQNAVLTLNENVLPPVQMNKKGDGALKLTFSKVIKVEEGSSLTVNLLD
eukprot:gene7677-8513_t